MPTRSALSQQDAPESDWLSSMSDSAKLQCRVVVIAGYLGSYVRSPWILMGPVGAGAPATIGCIVVDSASALWFSGEALRTARWAGVVERLPSHP